MKEFGNLLFFIGSFLLAGVCLFATSYCLFHWVVPHLVWYGPPACITTAFLMLVMARLGLMFRDDFMEENDATLSR